MFIQPPKAGSVWASCCLCQRTHSYTEHCIWRSVKPAWEDTRRLSLHIYIHISATIWRCYRQILGCRCKNERLQGNKKCDASPKANYRGSFILNSDMSLQTWTWTDLALIWPSFCRSCAIHNPGHEDLSDSIAQPSYIKLVFLLTIEMCLAYLHETLPCLLCFLSEVTISFLLPGLCTHNR